MSSVASGVKLLLLLMLVLTATTTMMIHQVLLTDGPFTFLSIVHCSSVAAAASNIAFVSFFLSFHFYLLALLISTAATANWHKTIFYVRTYVRTYVYLQIQEVAAASEADSLNSLELGHSLGSRFSKQYFYI